MEPNFATSWWSLWMRGNRESVWGGVGEGGMNKTLSSCYIVMERHERKSYELYFRDWKWSWGLEWWNNHNTPLLSHHLPSLKLPETQQTLSFSYSFTPTVITHPCVCSHNSFAFFPMMFYQSRYREAVRQEPIDLGRALGREASCDRGAVHPPRWVAESAYGSPRSLGHPQQHKGKEKRGLCQLVALLIVLVFVVILLELMWLTTHTYNTLLLPPPSPTHFCSLSLSLSLCLFLSFFLPVYSP